MILSFAWTWPAFVAQAKSVTRRAWKPNYAERWKGGTEFDAYDRSPRFKGRKIGVGQLVGPARLRTLSSMPHADYGREGFQYLYDHPQLVPPSRRKQLWEDWTWAGFDKWRLSGGSVWVVRFEILEIEPEATQRLESMMEDRPTERAEG